MVKNWIICIMQFQGFVGLAAMEYEPFYHAPEIATIKWSSGYSCKAKISKIYQYLLIVFNKTIIRLALVGHKMIIANEAFRASLAIYHLISNAISSWNNC